VILPVYLYNHPVLRNKAETISDFNQELRDFAQNMFETMHNAIGIGLAANQVGSTKALTVIDISELEDGIGTKPMILINPVIDAFSDEVNEFEEGCLSVPDIREMVTRPAGIQVSFNDENMRQITMEAEGLLARVMQHEIDHLNGVYFFERMSPIRRTLSKSKLRKIERGQIEPDYPHIQGK